MCYPNFPRWAPAASFAWFCILIVWLYLFLQLSRRHGETDLFKSMRNSLVEGKFGITPQKWSKNVPNWGAGHRMVQITPPPGSRRFPMNIDVHISILQCHGSFDPGPSRYSKATTRSIELFRTVVSDRWTGSWVLRSESGAHPGHSLLVQWLSWVFETQERKKVKVFVLSFLEVKFFEKSHDGYPRPNDVRVT